MRKAIRAAWVFLLAYLLQSTVLLYLRINGVVPDVLLLTCYAFGYSFELPVALSAGVAASIVMECVGGELSVMSFVWCVGGTALGIWAAYLEEKEKLFDFHTGGMREKTKKTINTVVKYLIVCAGAGVAAFVKEGIQMTYFYLTGVELVWIHFSRVLVASLIQGVLAFALLGLLRGFLLRPFEKSYLYKKYQKHQKKKKLRRERKELRRKRAEIKNNPETVNQKKEQSQNTSDQ